MKSIFGRVVRLDGLWRMANLFGVFKKPKVASLIRFNGANGANLTRWLYAAFFHASHIFRALQMVRMVRILKLTLSAPLIVKKSSSYNLIQVLKINSGLLVSDQTRINYMATKTQERSDALKEFYDAPDSALFNQETVAAIRECSTATMERDRWAGTRDPIHQNKQSGSIQKS